MDYTDQQCNIIDSQGYSFRASTWMRVESMSMFGLGVVCSDKRM